MEVYSWENLRPEWWICQLATFDDTGELCIVPQVDAQRWASNPGDFLLWIIVTYAQQCEIQTSPCPEIQDNSSRLIFQNHVWCFTGVLLNIYTVYIYIIILYIYYIYYVYIYILLYYIYILYYIICIYIYNYYILYFIYYILYIIIYNYI